MNTVLRKIFFLNKGQIFHINNVMFSTGTYYNVTLKHVHVWNIQNYKYSLWSEEYLNNYNNEGLFEM